jgi:hypothetical protein
MDVIPPKTAIDLLAMNPNIRADFGNPDMRHYWDALLRINGWDKMDATLKGLPFNSTIDDVRKKLCGESLTLEDRTMKALKRRGAAGGPRQAQELIELVKCQGACDSREDVCDCLYWIFAWHVKRSLTIKWPSDFLPLVIEWKETGRPKQPKHT